MTSGFPEDTSDHIEAGDAVQDAVAEVDSGGSGADDAPAWADMIEPAPELETKPQKVDYEEAIMRYRRTAEMTVTGEWMQGFVARGFFNLGFIYQFGLGVTQDLNMAKQHYHRCREMDPSGMHTPVTLVLLFLGAHMAFVRLPPWGVMLQRLQADLRIHVLALHGIAIMALVVGRRRIARGVERGVISHMPMHASTSAPASQQPVAGSNADSSGGSASLVPQAWLQTGAPPVTTALASEPSNAAPPVFQARPADEQPTVTQPAAVAPIAAQPVSTAAPAAAPQPTAAPASPQPMAMGMEL